MRRRCTIAFGCFAELAYRASGSVSIAVVLATTLGISQPFSSAFSLPWTATAFSACTAVALALHVHLSEPVDAASAKRSALAVSCALLVAAAIVPAWTMAFALLAPIVMWRSFVTNPIRTRVAVSAMASVIVAGVPVWVARAVRSGRLRAGMDRMRVADACARSHDCRRPGDRRRRTSGPCARRAGRLPRHRRRRADAHALAGGFIALATVPALEAGVPAGIAAMPAVVAVWGLAAMGVREMWTRTPARGAIVAAMLLAALPLLQLSRARAVEREGFSRAAVLEREGFSRSAVLEREGFSRARVENDRRALLGHDRASLAQIRRLLNLMPDGAAIVEEDASVDLLLRAAAFGRRFEKPLAVVPRVRKDVAAALHVRRVYTFPLGQRELSLRGFVIDAITDVPRADARGIAAVSATRPCVELGKVAVDLDGIGAHGRVALVADEDAAVGPVVIYFGGETAYTPGPDGWPPGAMPGFALRMFDRSTEAHSALMDAEAAAAGLGSHPVFRAPFVARLTLFRATRAPQALPVVLGPPRSQGAGQLAAERADALPLTLCDAPTLSVSEF